jgi:hypothetical protein
MLKRGMSKKLRIFSICPGNIMRSINLRTMKERGALKIRSFFMRRILGCFCLLAMGFVFFTT